MTIKKKLSILLSVLLTLLFSIASFIVIYMYSNFRKEEFKKRLEEKALTSVKLLIDVKEVDKTLLKIIDQNTVNKLYDEKTLIFDDKFKCLYKSLDDIKINWRIEDLVYLQKNKEFFRKEAINFRKNIIIIKLTLLFLMIIVASYSLLPSKNLINAWQFFNNKE